MQIHKKFPPRNFHFRWLFATKNYIAFKLTINHHPTSRQKALAVKFFQTPIAKQVTVAITGSWRSNQQSRFSAQRQKCQKSQLIFGLFSWVVIEWCENVSARRSPLLLNFVKLSIRNSCKITCEFHVNFYNPLIGMRRCIPQRSCGKD